MRAALTFLIRDTQHASAHQRLQTGARSQQCAGSGWQAQGHAMHDVPCPLQP